jgi:Ca2+-binding RTX toxin-like protein
VGTDVLVLVGSGFFGIDQLTSFTGFENITVDNPTNSLAILFNLGSQPIEVDVTGNAEIDVSSPSNWNSSDIINGDPSHPTTLAFDNPGLFSPPVTYDLTSNKFSHVDISASLHIILTINNSDTAGVQSFTGSGDELVTAGSTLDLSHTTVTGFTVTSTNALGTTFTVGDLGTALQIAGGPGNDTIVAKGFTFTPDEREAIFAAASIEKIIDKTGTYYALTITSETISNGKVTLTGATAEANDTISVYSSSTLLGMTTTASDGTWKFTTGTVSNSVHTYTFEATDVAGNIGYSSNVAILGSSQTDSLVGTSGNDIIIGNGGNDKITGGGGADLLTGGTGNVTFIYNAVTDSGPTNHDTITDFRHNHDKIDFTNIAGINARSGVPTFEGELTGPGNLTLNAHSVAYIQVGSNTEVLVNTTNHAEIVTSSNVTSANIEIVLVGINLGLTSTNFHHV